MHKLREWKARLRHTPKPPPNTQPDPDQDAQDIYSTTPLAPNTTRMVRLLPQQDRSSNTPIQCELIAYDLSAASAGGEKHIYEALSYVWGSDLPPQAITLNGRALSVTGNLHAALWHLRDRQLERVLWVDAICINQADTKEKERQIPLMRAIYAQAARVIVWLGPPLEDRGDEALRHIRRLAQAWAPGEAPTPRRVARVKHDGCEMVLRRDWFRRIWILQEVGGARSVVVMCGSVQIDGHAFCEGLAGLELALDLQIVVHPVVRLIRDASYRPKHELGSRGVFSMGELLDMSRSCRAALQHDKIYALLGLSAEGLDTPALQPDYGLPWHQVFRRATAHTFGPLCIVETWPGSHTAVITGKCVFLGQITSVSRDIHADGQVHVTVVPTTAAQSLGYGERPRDWAFPPFAEPVRVGDIVCHLQGVAKPSIVRLCQDHFTIIKITAPPLRSRGRDGESDGQLGSREDHFCNIALTFTIPPGSATDWAGVKESAELLDVTPKYYEEPVEKRKRLFDIAALLEDGLVFWRMYSGSIPLALERLIEQCGPEIPISERAVRAVTEYTMGEPDKVLRFLFEKRGDKLPITEKVVGAAAANWKMGYTVLELLFSKRGKRLPVSEHVMVAAVGNKEIAHWIMELLFKQRGRELLISEEVVVAAAGNDSCGLQTIELLFEQRGEDVPVSERVVKAAAANTICGYGIIRTLFQQRGSLQISVEVVVQAAGNSNGHRIIQLLFERDGDLVVSEDAVKAAAENRTDGYKIIHLFLEKRGEDLPVSERVVKAAAANDINGYGIIQALFQQHGTLQILEEVVVQAAGNAHGHLIIQLLFERDRDLVVSENAVKAAAGNRTRGYEIMLLLLEKRGRKGLAISEEVVKAAQGNFSQPGRDIMQLLGITNSTAR